MEAAFASAQEGCQQDRLEFPGMLDSRRVLVDTKTTPPDALAEYHIARVNVQRLTGATINTLSTVKMKQE